MPQQFRDSLKWGQEVEKILLLTQSQLTILGSARTMAAATPATIEITSCALGGHLLGRGTAVQKAAQQAFPGAKVTNTIGCPLQFSITVDDKPVLSGFAGSCTIMQLLTCCTSPEAVVARVPHGEAEVVA